MPTPENIDTDAPKPKRLAIGVEGGFDGRGFTEVKETMLACYDEASKNIYTAPLEIIENNQYLENYVNTIVAMTSTDKKGVEAWEGDLREVEPLLNPAFFIQRKLPVDGPGLNLFKCDLCDKCDNLWLNLGTGFVGCGRKYYDGTGGNNHAIEHFQTVGEAEARFSVKIGTICPNIEYIDIYDYKADKFVKDPWLDEHLKHFGVDYNNSTKTEKTVTEMEIDLNKKLGNEWDVIQESGHDLIKAETTFGIENLGSTCYINAVIQALAVCEEVNSRFGNRTEFHELIKNLDKQEVEKLKDNYEFQIRKLFTNVIHGSNVDLGEHVEIRPRAFKVLIGKGHQEFATWSQQDSGEWFQHFLEVIDRNCRTETSPNLKNFKNPASFFTYQVEERLQCSQSQKWRVTSRSDNMIQVPINPDDARDNCIPFESTISRFFAPADISGFKSPETNQLGAAQKWTKMTSFPDLLMVQLGKFYFDDQWQPKKYNIEVDVPNEFSLAAFKNSSEKIADSELLPEEGPVEVQIDMVKVRQLVEMGFSENACKRAIHTVGEVSAGLDWLCGHLEDPDLNDPFQVFVAPVKTSGKNSIEFKAEDIMMITSMGFTEKQAKKALKNTDNNVARAADWIFSHMDELDDDDVDENDANKVSTEPEFTDGNAEYVLRAIISHMGSNATAGHYVSHVRKNVSEDKWVIVNDEKASHSVAPPKKMGYLYLFERKKY